jgi:DNA-binding MarR family transcriptional regulator
MAVNELSDALDEVVSDIKTRYPTLEATGLPITGRVLRLAQLLQARREQELAQFGVSVADFDVLATLRRKDSGNPVNVRDLQRAMMLSSSGITKRLDRLERAALIARHPDPDDRRGVLIELTRSGRELIDQAIPAVTRFETELVSQAIGSEPDRRKLETSLRRLLVSQEAG